MWFKAFRLLLAAVAIAALVGCASFQDSFGEITDLFGAGAEPPALTSDVAARTPSSDSQASRKNLAIGGVTVQLNDGRLME